jgi:hypothetical protein
MWLRELVVLRTWGLKEVEWEEVWEDYTFAEITKKPWIVGDVCVFSD